MISGISFAALPGINFKGGTEKSSANDLERTPNKDTVSFGSRIQNKISPELKKEFDTKICRFEMGDGSTFEGTIREFLEASVIRWNKTNNETMYHVPGTTDVGEQILRNGLDWTKASRIQAGPSTYFSPSLGCGEFSGLGYKAIEATYCGNKDKYPVMEKGFYDRLKAAAPDMPAQYYHDVMVDDLGADFIYCATGRAGGAYVVLNDDCVHLRRGW